MWSWYRRRRRRATEPRSDSGSPFVRDLDPGPPEDDGSDVSDTSEERIRSNGQGRAADNGRVSALAERICQHSGPAWQQLHQMITDQVATGMAQGREFLERQIAVAVEDIGRRMMDRIEDAATNLQLALIERLDDTAARHEAETRKMLADQVAAMGRELKQACSITAQRSAQGPLVDQSIALLDRIRSERSFLDARFRRDPNWSLDVGCRRLHEDHDAAMRSLESEVLTMLRQLGVEPIEGAAGTVNLRHQQIVAVEPTNQPDRDGQVARVVRAGFLRDGVVLRPEQIIVYKLEKNHVQ